jgi:hypothetical protein
MTARASLLRPVAALGFVAAFLLACNGSLTLDNVRLQQVIADGLQQQAGVQAVVTCPDDRPLKTGDTFQCSAVAADGSTLQITVVQTDDQGHVNWNVTGVS